MSLLRTFETGLRGIAAHRLRSILTTLGILFGVAAVISTVGIGQASSNAVNSRIASLGTNELTITGGSSVSGGVRGGAGTAQTLTMADVTGLSAQARADRVAAGQVEASGVRLRDGNLAGTGDWIVTRLNDRRLGLFGGRDDLFSLRGERPQPLFALVADGRPEELAMAVGSLSLASARGGPDVRPILVAPATLSDRDDAAHRGDHGS